MGRCDPFFYCGCETGWICVCKVFVYCIGYACATVIDCAPSKTIAAACLTSDSARRRTLPAKQRPSIALQAALVVVGQHVKLYLAAAFHQVYKAITNGYEVLPTRIAYRLVESSSSPSMAFSKPTSMEYFTTASFVSEAAAFLLPRFASWMASRYFSPAAI